MFLVGQPRLILSASRFARPVLYTNELDLVCSTIFARTTFAQWQLCLISQPEVMRVMGELSVLVFVPTSKLSFIRK